MKTFKLLMLVLTVIIGTGISAVSQDTEELKGTSVSEKDGVIVYYFHFERRCATCHAVENVSRESVEELYGDKVSFEAFNLDEEEGEIKGSEVDVTGQSLLIVSGDTKIDITNEGFMNARSNPDKLKKIIKEKVDPLL